MLKYCVKKWDANKEKLKKRFETERYWEHCEYADILKAVIDTVLNTPIDGEVANPWDSSNVHEIDDGSYQGTLLYLFPANTSQPGAGEYLMTYVYYGSCSGCDTLLAIQADGNGTGYLTERQVNDLMELAKDLLVNMRLPYNNLWGYDPNFEQAKF